MMSLCNVHGLFSFFSEGRSPIQKEAPNPHFRSTGSLIKRGHYITNPKQCTTITEILQNDHTFCSVWSLTNRQFTDWLVVEPTHFKNMSQIGNLPQSSGWKSTKKTLKPPPRWPLKNQPRTLILPDVFRVPFAKLLNHLRSCKFRVFEIKWMCGGHRFFFWEETNNEKNQDVLPTGMSCWNLVTYNLLI